MVYNVLFIQRDPRLDCRIGKLLTANNHIFDVTTVPPESPIPEDRYRQSDSVVAHVGLKRAQELRSLRIRHPETNLLLLPFGYVGNLHRDLQRDGDGAYFLLEGFTEQDLVDSIARLSRRTSEPSHVY